MVYIIIRRLPIGPSSTTMIDLFLADLEDLFISSAYSCLSVQRTRDGTKSWIVVHR